MKYSIIIPIYKVENYLRECLDSVVNQTYNNIEIILVNDGSSDTCGDICDEYALKDNRIRVIHKKNGGLVSARKVGAEIATGEYICCVDGDDYIEATYVEGFHDIIKKYNVDIVCCGYKKVSPKSITEQRVNAGVGYYNRERIEKSIFPFLISGERGEYFLPTLWGKAIRRELYQKYQLSLSDVVSMGEDGAVIIPCVANASSMFVSPLFNYYYRFNPRSMTKGRYVLSWEGQIKIAEHLRKHVDLSQNDFLDQYYRRILKGFFVVAKSQYNRDSPSELVAQEIFNESRRELFAEAIDKVKYKGIKMNLIHFLIKEKQFFIIKILNKFL